MRRLLFWVLVGCGLGFLLLVGLQTALLPATVHAQGPDEAQYVGARACNTCHQGMYHHYGETNHAHALQDVADSKDPILADFSQGEDVRTVLFPGEDAPRPFTADDIAYTIGAGRYMQGYVYQSAPGQYLVLPAQWNTVTGAWEPYTQAETWPDPAYEFGPNCARCHTVGLDVTTYTWINDGVLCEACHGPGSTHITLAGEAAARLNDEQVAAVRAAIYFQPDPQVCGQCHNSGTAPDGHPYPVDYLPGDNLLDPATFTLHGPDDPAYWWPTGHARLTTMQFNEWITSAHASALTTARGSTSIQDECLHCHSTDYRFNQRLIADFAQGYYDGQPPDPLTAATATLGVTCTACHNPHSEDYDFLLVDEPYAICTGCHTNTTLFESGVHHPVKEMFEGVTMVESVTGIPAAHRTAADGPDCLTCHMSRLASGRASHALKPIQPADAAPDEGNVCSPCHTDLTITDLQALIDDTQATTRARLTLDLTRLRGLTQPDPDTDARTLYDQVQVALAFVQNDGSLGVHNYAYVDALLTFAERMLSELSVPGSSLEPTEAPAPTATPSTPPQIILEPPIKTHTGFRPITGLLIGLVVLILLGGAVTFFRRSKNGEHDR